MNVPEKRLQRQNYSDLQSLLFELDEMGTPLPINPAGSLCNECWGSGKPFGLGPTPEIVTITLFDLEEGDRWDPIIGAQALVPTQLFQSEFPCIWLAFSSTIRFAFQFGGADTILVVVEQPIENLIFLTGDNLPCERGGPNALISPDQTFAFNGRFEVTWSEIFT